MPSDREPASQSLTRGPALWAATVDPTASPDPRPGSGTSGGGSWSAPPRKTSPLLYAGDGLLAPMERGAIDPHAVQNRRQLARQSDLGTFQAAPFRHVESPALQAGEPRHPAQHDIGRFVESDPYHLVADPAD